MSWSSRAIRARSSATATCGRLAFALGLGCAFFRCFGLLGTLTQGVARDPGDDEPQRNEDEVAGRQWTRDVVDDDHDPGENDDQTCTRLQGFRRFPSRNAVAKPTTPRLPMNASSSPSTNESAAARGQ